jgi:hypothetical protein
MTPLHLGEAIATPSQFLQLGDRIQCRNGRVTMVSARALLLVVVCGAQFGCSRQELPTQQVLDFHLNATTSRLLCTVKIKNAVVSDQVDTMKALVTTLQAIQLTGRRPPSTGADTAVPTSQQAAQKCVEEHSESIAADWAAASKTVSAQEAKVLEEYYKHWRETMGKLTPIEQDLKIDRGEGYEARSMALGRDLENEWSAYVLEKMPAAVFCVREFPMLDIKATLVRQVYALEEVDFDAVKSKKLKVGISKCSALAVFGEPDRVTATTDALGRREVLWYSPARQMTFTNNKLVSFSE